MGASGIQPETVQGAGVGLRTPHVSEILQDKPNIPWFEILADNWMASGGLNPALLEAVCDEYPTVLHGVGLSLGAIDPIDLDYLANIKALKQSTGALWYSEHCSFSVHKGQHIPDLLPLPFTTEAARHISDRIIQVQGFLGERILLENVSSYIQSKDNEMTEAEFISTVADLADCYLLLDINNCYVTELNNQESSRVFLETIPIERVKQIHLAGYEIKENYLLDAHNNPVCDTVWTLFEDFVAKHGSIPTLIEWDHDIPDLAVLLQEQEKAQRILDATETTDTQAAVCQ